jgi:hypothetical protein
MKSFSITLVPLTVLLLTPKAALADEIEEAPVAEAPPPAPSAPMEAFRVSGGVKVGYVSTRGFDTFADSNTLPQFSIDGTYMFWSRGRLGLAAGLGYDVGNRGDSLRGLDTSLTTHKFLVPLEARAFVTPWLWGFGKVAPGAALLVASINDPSSPHKLAGSGWAFATDLSAGATFVIGPRREDKRTPRFLVTPEIGYSLTTAASLGPNPGRDENELLGADANTNVQPVALSGFFWRTTVGVAF